MNDRKSQARNNNVRDLLGRVPPSSEVAEQGVLGGIMLDNRVFHEVATIIGPEDFYRDGHAIIFKAMTDMSRRDIPIDIVTLVDKLGEDIGRAGGAPYIASLPDLVPSVSHVKTYAQTVRDKATLRKIIIRGHEIAGEAYDLGNARTDGNINVFVDSVITRMVNTASETAVKTHASAAEVYLDVTKSLEKNNCAEGIGIKTGIDSLDDFLGGLVPAYYIIAARPGKGKTSLALNIARHVQKEKHVVIFSAEMSRQQLMHRMIAMETGIDSNKILFAKLNEHEQRMVYDAGEKFNNMNMHIDDLPEGPYIETIVAQSNYMKRLYDTGLIIVDYIQLIEKKPTGSRYRQTREEKVTEVSRTFKQLWKRLDIPVIVLSQFSRPMKGMEEARYTLSDLRESGSIEQDLDVALFLYQNKEMEVDKKLEITVPKNRHGRRGWCNVTFEKEFQKIY